MGIHKILAPVDFSTCSKEALRRAAELSERYFGASIDVLHVWERPQHVGPGVTIVMPSGARQTIEEAARIQALKEMESFLSEVERREIVTVRRLHEIGDPVPTILEVAARGYDLIVMGTHGRTGVNHDYLGSVAEKVVRRAPCPVLTFREQPVAKGDTLAVAASVHAPSR